jgi:tetratricopeptide (TPR) repeat protein
MGSIIEQEIKNRFYDLKNKACLPEIAELITYAFQVNSGASNRKIFGYIPEIFREIEIKHQDGEISREQVFLGEPVIYKIYFGRDRHIVQIPYFYIFCYLKPSSYQLNVYFQSANHQSKLFTQEDYILERKKVFFEGMISAFEQDVSTICISDPGHFIPNQHSSYYVGTPEINFAQLISQVVENICNEANISLKDTFLCGASAGGVGALLSSTYFSSKVHVMSINSQIDTYGIPETMRVFLGTDDQEFLLTKYAAQVSCIERFQQDIKSIPNIYLLVNVNDNIHPRNYQLYQIYQQLFVSQGKNNQSIFDSYYGAPGHNQPERNLLKAKIKFGRENLMLELNPEERLKNKQSAAQRADVEFNKALESQEQGNIKQAIVHYKKAISLHPEYKSIIELVKIYQAQEQYEDAAQYCRLFLKLHPKHSYMHVWLARILRQQEQFHNAIITYQKAIELKPELSGNIYRELGDLLLYKKDDAIAAVTIYQQGLNNTQQWQPNWEYYFNLATALSKTQNLTEATEYCHKALELNPTMKELISPLLTEINSRS